MLLPGTSEMNFSLHFFDTYPSTYYPYLIFLQDSAMTHDTPTTLTSIETKDEAQNISTTTTSKT